MGEAVRFHLDYAASELRNRRGRYAISILGIAIAIALLISLSALSAAFQDASHIPLEEVNADLIVQKYGRVPQAVSGPILSCAVGPITQGEVDRIRRIDGVRDVSSALLIWAFDRDYFKIVTGIDPDSSLGKLMAAQVVEGEFISSRNRTAVVEKNFALMHGIKLNDTIRINNSDYTVTGILAAQRKDRIGATNILVPMKDAQEIAYNAKNIQNTVRFGRTDVNLLFLGVDQDKETAAKNQIGQILGKNSRVSSMTSFLPQLASVSVTAGSFSTITTMIAVIVAVLLLFKNTAAGIFQRKNEIGLMKAVGWTGRDIRAQFIIESTLLGVAGGLAGVLLGRIAILSLGMVDITIPVPQDLLPNPFLTSGAQRHISLPITFPSDIAIMSFALSIILGVMTGILASKRISAIAPAEVLKYE